MSHGTDHAHEEHHVIPYSTYIHIWLALVLLTSLTIVASTVNVGATMNVVVAMAIATFKSSLVIGWFMHAKYDWPLLRILMFISLATAATIISLMIVDWSQRF